MTPSMPAFARRSAEFPAGAVVWELRSVNHRYLDIGLRLPDELRSIEAGARELMARRLERGKVDATLKFQVRESVAGSTLDAAAGGPPPSPRGGGGGGGGGAAAAAGGPAA